MPGHDQVGREERMIKGYLLVEHVLGGGVGSRENEDNRGPEA